MSSGYITNYIQQSDGTFDCTLNTLDSSENQTSIHLYSVDLIKNEWCLTSLNNLDQILIMTNDSKYIYVPSIPFMTSQTNKTLYNTLITLCIDFYMIELSTPSSYITTLGTGIPVPNSNNNLKTLKNAAQLAMYIYIYFFINYGIGSYTSTNKIADIFQNQTLTLNSNDPYYNTWNQLASDTKQNVIIKQIFLVYAICMNHKNYMNILDPNSTLSINVTDSDWNYFGNFFKTIYQLYSYDASNFCVNLTGNINHISNILSTPSSSPSSTPFHFSSPSSTATLYIPECVDCRVISLNATSNINTNSLCNKPSITINTEIIYTPEEVHQMNNKFLFTMCILIIILIIIAVIYWYFNRNNESIVKNNNYYYI